MRFGILLFFLIVFGVACRAQQLWLKPDKYFYKVGEKAKVDLQSGMDFIGAPVKFRRDDVESLETIFRTTKMDIRKNFIEGEKAHFTFDVTNEGIFQYVFKEKTVTDKLDATTFNEYLKQYGMDELYSDREKKGTLQDSATVVKEQWVRGYVRGGEQFDRRPELPAGFPIEVIPDKNPLLLSKGEKISFTVFVKGQPAFGVLVKIWNRWDNRTTIQHIYTQQDGSVSTSISSPGDWMVTVVEMKESSDSNQYFANTFNLIFGYR